MKIFLFSNWLPPITSGSSFYASSLAQSLSARGHDVHVVTLDWGPEFAPLPIKGVQIHLLPVRRLPQMPLFFNMKLMGLAFSPANVRRLRALIRLHRPDILHHVNHIFDTTYLSTYAAKREHIPIVGSLTTPIQHQNPLKQSIMQALDRLCLGWPAVRWWDAVVCLDRSGYDYARRVYGTSILRRSAIIPFGVRMDSMNAYEDPSVLRSSRPQIVLVGHLHPFRNPYRLVQAMPLVLRQVPTARLVFAGRISVEEPVAEARRLGLTADQVQFLGDTPHSESIRLMKESHIFASWVTGPYLGLGTAPMEAMLCETPVINDCPPDLFGEGTLRDGENIVLVDSQDPESIARGILRLLQDPAYSRKIGQGGRQFVLSHLSWESIAAQMESLYQKLIH